MTEKKNSLRRTVEELFVTHHVACLCSHHVADLSNDVEDTSIPKRVGVGCIQSQCFLETTKNVYTFVENRVR